MIDESQLSYPRGTLVEFRLHLGRGTTRFFADWFSTQQCA